MSCLPVQTLQVLCAGLAIRVLHKTEGAHQGRPEMPGKTPNGLSTDLYPVGSTIEVFPFVGERTKAGNLGLSGSACD